MIYDWHTVVGIFSTVVMLSLLYPYIQSMIVSTTKPSPVSWFGWSLLYGIATAAQLSKGIDWSIIIPLIGTFSTATIALMALRMGKVIWTKADYFCVGSAILAILLWAVTGEPLIALIFSIIADVAVTLPTLIKTYQYPESEPVILWILYTVSVLLALIATTEYTLYNLLSPIESFITDIAITILAFRSNFTVARTIR